MKAVLAAAALLALAPAVALAQPAFDQGAVIRIKGKGHGKGQWKHHRGHDDGRAYYNGYREGRRDARREARYYDGYRPGYSYGYGYDQGYRHWSRGQVLPYEYRRYPVYNYDDYGWAPPPRGHAYYRTNTGDIILAAVATGLIVSILTR